MRQLKTPVRRAAATAVVLLTMSALNAHLAYAGGAGSAAQTQTITSGSWKVTSSSTIITFPTSLSPSTPQYITVSNTGTLSLLGTTYSIIIAGVSTGTAAIKACSGTWNETAHTCSGSTSTIISGTTATSPVTSSTTTSGQYPANPTNTIRLQVSNSAAVVVALVVTLTLSVSRTQVRAATTTND
ncbi:MAG: hypothetical protein QOG53_735 [Frankiales bacterium]|nr:hypothetical protein [Frankiales bacterium]